MYSIKTLIVLRPPNQRQFPGARVGHAMGSMGPIPLDPLFVGQVISSSELQSPADLQVLLVKF